MLVIRLQRRGRKGLAIYRVVVQDKRTHPSKEKLVARLGSYNPHTKELNIDKEEAQKFVDNGAQPSDRVIALLEKTGVKLPAWVKKVEVKTKTLRNPEKLRKNQPKEEVVETPAEAEEAPEETKEEVTEETQEVVTEPETTEEASDEA